MANKGSIVVRTNNLNGEHNYGDGKHVYGHIFKVIKDAKSSMAYYKEHTFTSHFRYASQHEIVAFNEGINNVKNILTVVDKPNTYVVQITSADEFEHYKQLCHFHDIEFYHGWRFVTSARYGILNDASLYYSKNDAVGPTVHVYQNITEFENDLYRKLTTQPLEKDTTSNKNLLLLG